MSAKISIDPIYAMPTDTVNITVTGSPSVSTRTKMFLRTTGETLTTASYNGIKYVFSITADKLFRTMGDNDTYITISVGFSSPDFQQGIQEYSNSVRLFRKSPLAKPVIISIMPKSPKISETLTIKWNQVKHADYYTLYVYVDGHSYDIQKNISATRFGEVCSTTTVPNRSLPGLKQEGKIAYGITAYSNNQNLYPSSSSDRKIVNLDLASNLRYRRGDVWIRGTPYIKVGGQWRKAVKTYIKVNGVWKNA